LAVSDQVSLYCPFLLLAKLTLFNIAPASNTSAFGSTSTSTGGFFGQRPATGGFGSTPTTTAFGQPQQPQQQQQTPAFGGFGAGGAAFNQPAAGANQGTAIADFTATQDRDITTGVNNFFQTITAMPQYKDYSLEELRLQDYVQGRKNAAAAGGAFSQPAAGGAFGQTTSTMGGGAFGQPSTGGAFGQPAASTGFGQPAQSNMFGAPANTGGMFGQQQQQQQQPTTAFGQSTGTNAFGSTTNAFGTTGASTTGFGAGTTGGAFGASAAKPFGFGKLPIYQLY
jgi:nuclear pore complex protein Nup98-Nup96